MDFERWNEKFAGFSVFTNSLQEQLKPYAEEWKAVEQNAKSLLIDFTEKTKPLRAFNILADHQFTYWNPLQSDDVEKILNSYDVDQYLLERIEDKGFIDYDTLCKEMESSELLSATNKSILQQTVKAIEAELYDLALAGAVIVFDGVLTEATSNASTNISRRIEDIRNKMEKLSDEEWECLGEKEITVFGMYITWTKTMEGYAIILREEFSCLESITNRDTINWILKNEYRRSIMEHLPKRITENGIDYILVGDYYIPDLRLPEESRPIGRWGRMHRDYLKEWRPVLYNDLLLSGRFWTYLADLNEQAQNRLEVITEQMKAASMLPFRNWTKPCCTRKWMDRNSRK